MRIRNFVITTGEVNNNPEKTITVPSGGSGKRITIDSSHLMGDLMNLAGGTMTISDGSSNRVITFGFSASNDDDFNVSSGSGPFSTGTDTGEQHIVSRINGSNGGSVNVTASNVNDSSSNAVVDIVHNAGGTVTITFQQNTASNIGSDFLVVSDISAGTVDILVAQEVVTGSVAQSRLTNTPHYGKITLRNGRHSPESLAAYNVTIGENDITYSNDSFHITGSLSGASDPTKTEAKRVSGDFIIVSEGK